jgi:predicted dehydrogenase
MTGPLRIGLIGAGNFAQHHIRAYLRQGMSVVAVADSDRQRAEAVAARWGIEQWFGDGAELLAACRPDGVSVVTPGNQHREPTIAALELDCSVLLEKPVATSSVDVAAIEAAGQASGAFVMPAHILRFAAPYQELHARVAAGALGRLLSLSTVRDRERSHADLFPDIHPALMTTIHDIDLALWLSEARAVRVVAHQRGGPPGGSPLVVWAQVEASDGSVWSLRVSWVLPDGAQLSDRLEVYGVEGAAVLDLRPTVALLGSTAEGIDHELTPAAHPGAIDAEIAYFCRCIRDGVAPSVVTFAEAAHGVRIAEAIIESAGAGGVAIDVSA